MATIKFKVMSKEQGTLAPVYIRFAEGRGIDVTVRTEFKIMPEAWGKKEKINTDFCNEIFTLQDAHDLLNHIGDLRMFVLKKYTPGLLVTREWLQVVVNEYHHPGQPVETNPKQSETLNEFIKRYIAEVEAGKRVTKDQKQFAASTVKALKGFQVQFDNYQDSIKKKINFKDIHQDFYKSFVAYFQEKKYRQNTIGRHLKDIKIFMNAALDEGLHSNIEHTRKSFSVLKEKIDVVYLTENELKSLYELELTDKAEITARDIFLCGCYSGQRFSDYSRFSKAHLREMGDGRKMLEIRQQKTGMKILIPMRWELEAILTKYNYQLPKIFEQKLNLNIKTIAGRAGITEPVEITEFIGGLKKTFRVSKNELIKTHTARRTALTLLYQNGVPISEIMALSGHTTEARLRGYLGVDLMGAVQSLSKTAFFSTPQMKVG